MGKYVWPVLVVALSLLLAGAWVAFPQARRTAAGAVSAFCASFAAEARAGVGRLFARADDGSVDLGDLAQEEAPAPLAADDPDPATLTREQRRSRYRELVAAADARKRTVLRQALSKSAEGREALRATLAYKSKTDEMKRLEAKYGAADDRLWALRLELGPLRDEAAIANARYKAWKAAHPEAAEDPETDPVYCDLVARSRFYRD